MSGPPKYLRMLLVACAGIGAFYVSAQWSRGLRDGQGEIVQTVAPAAAAAQPAPDPAAGAASAAAPSTAASTPPSAGASAAPSAAASAAQGNPSLSTTDRIRSIPKSAGNLFARLNWQPPAPPPPPPPPPAPPPTPAAPVAPPLPYTFVGMVERGAAKPTAFLAKGDALLVVAAGDTLDNGTYRVDSVNANEVVMTFLPVNIQQTLSAPGVNK